jgi:ubiquinone/menaquinone biosynthesis C-methylase UbiE
MTTIGLPDGVHAACPECGSPVGADLRCEKGHEAARLVDGVVDFRRGRSGVGALLADFWSKSFTYYEEARQANLDYADEGHASHRAVLDALQLAEVRTVLDVGCGTGEFAVALVESVPGAAYVGVDVSTLATRAAAELGRPGAFVAADAERLPFAEGTFDAVVSLYALEHFPAPVATLTEMCRVLRPGGTLALLSLSYDRPWGTIPSIRFGLVWRGRKLPSRHPANVVVYAANRLRFAARQTAKQLRYAVDRSYASFELVSRPLVLDEGYAADRDAVHVVSGRAVQRLLERKGLAIVDSSLGNGLRALQIPFDLRIVARKRGCPQQR